MITRRVVVNLVAFLVFAAALVGYGLFDLLGNPFAATTTVSTVLPSASGLNTGFSVAYDGIQVGSVAAITLVHHGAKVVMTIHPGEHVPADVAARVIIGNALGQQEIELVPRGSAGSSPLSPVAASTSGSSQRHATVTAASGRRHAVSGTAGGHPAVLRNGQVLPVAPDSAPADVGKLVTEATSILDAIPAGDLDSLLRQAAVAVSGEADNLKTITAASEVFSQEFLAYQNQFRALLANAPPVLNTVTANATALQQSLAETAAVVNVLANHRQDLVTLLHAGTTASEDLNTVVVDNRPDLGCLTHDLAAMSANLAEPANYANFGTLLQTNGEFFAIVKRVAPAGPARALTTYDHARNNQVQLRVRLLLPPRTPAAVTYNPPHGLTTIRPGAACDTEFGAGAGPATQPGFKAADGGTVDPPTAGEAQVRGGGPVQPEGAATTPTADQMPLPTGSMWPVLAAGIGAFAAVSVVLRRRLRTARACRVTMGGIDRGGRIRGRDDRRTP